MSYESNIA
ncbi:hypothetical protein JL09_g6757 [Pichia kudriavzevii]|uniref:Uncharacterized protein n=1 Tax=Pichia kudriavzevii TaxID=4909 RepID=A0A099NL10_PICKU|nr:hypothetical protein JL09_g6757 [Pichia kudriavzevii]